jgi:hypothetical protein
MIFSFGFNSEGVMPAQAGIQWLYVLALRFLRKTLDPGLRRGDSLSIGGDSSSIGGDSSNVDGNC